MNQAPGRPAWLEKIQKHGLTPSVLEHYLESGWPIEAIAKDTNLDIEDIKNAMMRWDLSKERDDASLTGSL
jgi:hypothetical protein